MTDSRFENVGIESSQFARAITTNTYFDNNWSFGQKVTQADFEEWIKDHEE